MKLHCNNCFKLQNIKVSRKDPHLQAHCAACKEFIKFLDSIEVRKLAIELLNKDKVNVHKTKRQKQRNHTARSSQRGKPDSKYTRKQIQKVTNAKGTVVVYKKTRS